MICILRYVVRKIWEDHCFEIQFILPLFFVVVASVAGIWFAFSYPDIAIEIDKTMTQCFDFVKPFIGIVLYGFLCGLIIKGAIDFSAYISRLIKGAIQNCRQGEQ